MGTPSVVPGWNPLGRPPATDDEIFELLAAAVFQARFRPAIVRRRWPAIRRAFAGFDLQTVAAWPDEEVERILEEPGMIRSPKKILATIRNARELLRRGGPGAWLASVDGGEEELVVAIDAWAHYIGAPSIRWFVRELLGGGTGG